MGKGGYHGGSTIMGPRSDLTLRSRSRQALPSIQFTGKKRIAQRKKERDEARRVAKQGRQPRRLTVKEVALAKSLLRNPKIKMDQVAQKLGIEVALLSRHLHIMRP